MVLDVNKQTFFKRTEEAEKAMHSVHYFFAAVHSSSLLADGTVHKHLFQASSCSSGQMGPWNGLMVVRVGYLASTSSLLHAVLKKLHSEYERYPRSQSEKSWTSSYKKYIMYSFHALLSKLHSEYKRYPRSQSEKSWTSSYKK